MFIKKRVFIPNSIGFVLLNTMFLSLTILCLITFILPFCGIVLSNREWLFHEDVLFVLAIVFLLYASIRFLLCFRIHLRKSNIITYGDGLPKFEKIQYKTIVDYVNIKNIAIVASDKNSKNKRIQLKWISGTIPKKYLEFTLMNDKKERICINYYTKKQIIKMLTYISINMKECKNQNSLNIDEIMKDWYSYGDYNRKDLKIKRGEKIRNKESKGSKE